MKNIIHTVILLTLFAVTPIAVAANSLIAYEGRGLYVSCLLYTSPSPRDRQKSRMPSSA